VATGGEGKVEKGERGIHTYSYGPSMGKDRQEEEDRLNNPFLFIKGKEKEKGGGGTG